MVTGSVLYGKPLLDSDEKLTNFCETLFDCIQMEASYHARMRYVIMNAVKHGLVQNPEDYPYSIYKYFVVNTQPNFRNKVFSCTEDVEVEGEISSSDQK